LADDSRAQFIARVDGRRKVSIGKPVQLALDNRSLHFFDPDSGVALGAKSNSTRAFVPKSIVEVAR
jgi:multiple sugar transport system ATP-binding protein